MTLQKITLIIAILFWGLCNALGQQLIDKTDYPEGLYLTKKDFICKKPSIVLPLTIEKLRKVNETDSLIRSCFFVNTETHKRVKKVFAISHNGYLYYSNWAIWKNKNKKDKSSSPISSMNSFVLVSISGSNYLYSEADFINPWQGAFSNAISNSLAIEGGVAGAIVGNEIGKSIDKTYPITTSFGTGVVWDIKEGKFNIFRNCNDFNEFIEHYPVEKIDCGKKIFELDQIREIMGIIK